MEKKSKLLPFSDLMHLIDALDDALSELEDNELITQALLDKLTSARQILDE